jgi:hypothetical protein
MDSPATATSVSEDTFEVRRARWGAAASIADQRLQERSVIVAVLCVCAFVTALAVVLYVR